MLTELTASAQPQSLAAPDTSAIRDRFVEDGYCGPIRILSDLECVTFLRETGRDGARAPLDWDKGRAVTSRAFLELAAHPKIMAVVCAILGGDVMLWGASIQERAAGAIHPWHSDIECAAASGKSVSVWIGLEHTRPGASLRLAAGSHRCGITVQELRWRAGMRREDTTDENIAHWLREQHADGHVVQPEVSEGEAFFMDGALWHASRNGLNETRRAVLLQYATPEIPIRIPDLNHLDWPFQRFELPRPACIMIRGNDTARVNRVVPAPTAVGADSKWELTPGPSAAPAAPEQ